MSALKTLITGLATVNEKLAIIFRFIAWTFMALMTAFIVTQVICRYGFNNSLFWPEDVSLMMMIWVAFAVAPIAYRIGANVALDTIMRLLHGRIVYMLYLIIHILLLGMLVVLTIEAVEMIARSKIRANSIDLQMKYIYMIMPISFCAMIIVGLELGLRCILGLFYPHDPVAQAPVPSGETVQQA